MKKIDCKTILFLGPDGSGKTTLIDYLERNLKFPVLRLYLGENNWSTLIAKKFHGKKNRLSRIIFVYFLYPLDLWLRTRKIKNSGVRIILIDRVPGFPFLGSWLLKKIYLLAIPKIDLIINLTGDSEKIWQRKKEGDLSKIEYYDKKWRKVAQKIRADRIFGLDTAQNSVEKSVEIIKSEILRELNESERSN